MRHKTAVTLTGSMGQKVNFTLKRSSTSPHLLGYHAGFVSRLLSLLIDLLLLILILAIVSLLLTELTTVTRSLWSSLTGKELSSLLTQLTYSVLGIFTVYAVYFIFFWTFLGKTVGGIIIGLRLVNREGGKPSFWRCTVRFLVEFGIPGMLIIGSIWIFINPRRRSIFDLISGTFVVYDWKAIGDESMPKLRWPITRDINQIGIETQVSDESNNLTTGMDKDY